MSRLQYRRKMTRVRSDASSNGLKNLAAKLSTVFQKYHGISHLPSRCVVLCDTIPKDNKQNIRQPCCCCCNPCLHSNLLARLSVCVLHITLKRKETHSSYRKVAKVLYHRQNCLRCILFLIFKLITSTFLSSISSLWIN